MRKTIALVAEELLKRAVIGLPDDVEIALANAYSNETKEVAKEQLKIILENIGVARKNQTALCQDTGTISFFVRGKNLTSEIRDGIFDGVLAATKNIPLRPNSVNPLTRKNIGNHPFIHLEFSDNDYLEISVIPKGAGCENMSALFMLRPSDGLEGVRKAILTHVAQKAKNACPPIVLGIGIGGTPEQAMLSAKENHLKKLTSKNPDPILAELEARLLTEINELGVGTMGLGGLRTALSVKILSHPCHTASLPVAVNIECWADRRLTARIFKDGKIEYF
ncbi:fumarate hydratase [Candidatus Micrarchaeota archaeon]|nr:fumarate hydratase [Candidatus Micrarchaeota archaeon]